MESETVPDLQTTNSSSPAEEASCSSKRRGRKPKPDQETQEVPKRESSTKSKYKKPTSIVSVGAFEDPTASSSATKQPLLFFKVENTILHFPIRTDMGPTLAEKTPHLFEDRVSENSPLPFDPNTTLNYTLEQQSDPCSNYSFFQPNQFQSSTSQSNRDYRIIPVLPSFTEEAKNGRLPDRTDVACYWCTERFDSCPIGLPEKKVGDSFYVNRCFCDFNCCAAYNFRMDDDRMWERYSLLNLMYQKVFNTNQIIRVQQAPPRESLIKFGGRMTIEEFRNYSKQNNRKCLKIVEFPVITLQNYIEEVGENQSLGSVSDTGSIQQAIDIKTQIDKANEQYKLSRKKTSTNKNSLEVCMGLKNF